jgi:CBS domain-containing protein
MLVVQETGFHGMPPNCGDETGTATQIRDRRLGHTTGGGYVHRKHSEAEGHRRHNNSSGSKHQECRELAPRKEYWRSRGDEWDAVLGLISEREIVHAFSRYGETVGSMPVKEIMQYGVTTVSPDESVNRVMNLMTHHRMRHMPILRGGKLAGIISVGDVVKYRLEELDLETNVLRDAYNAAR